MLYSILAMNKGWLFTMFSKIRGEAISTATASIKLAMGIACIIVVFKMIRLSYDIMSDDKQAGFGGVQLWSVLRPVLLLVLLQSCTLWVGALDSLTNVVTTSISSTVDAAADHEQLVQVVTEDEIIRDGLSADAVRSVDAQARKEFQDKIETWRRYNGFLGNAAAFVADNFGGENRAAKKALNEYALEQTEDPERNGRAIRQAINGFVRSAKKTSINESGDYVIDIHDKNMIPMICNWLYDNLYAVIQCFAEIILMVLAMCAPWVVVISLIEPWKGALFGFISAYVQVSFWKVIAAMINFATILFRRGAVGFCMDNEAANVVNAIGDSQLIADVAVGKTGTAILLSAIVSVAGVFALMKVSDIANAIIPSTNSIGSASGGATGGMAPVKGVVGAAKTGVKTGASAIMGAAVGGNANASATGIPTQPHQPQQPSQQRQNAGGQGQTAGNGHPAGTRTNETQLQDAFVQQVLEGKYNGNNPSNRAS